MARLVFMGTSHFSLPILQALFDHHQVVGVVTRPDSPIGRGRRLVPAPVKEFATQRALPLLQTETLRAPASQECLEQWAPQAIVVAAFGLLVPSKVLRLPPKGCLNVHPSLLPKYRGASPVAAAILAGDAETGVTVILMDEGLDSGPILAQRRISISEEDDRASLEGRLVRLGASLILEVLPAWLEGQLTPQPQNNEEATYAPALKKEEGFLDWHQAAQTLGRKVRAYYPWPNAYTTWQGRQLTILRAKAWSEWRGPEPPGKVLATPQGVGVATGEGLLLLRELQLAGKRALSIEDFLRGQRDFVGSYLGN